MMNRREAVARMIAITGTMAVGAELFLSGPGIVGLAFAPGKNLILATSNALYRVHVGIDGRRAP